MQVITSKHSPILMAGWTGGRFLGVGKRLLNVHIPSTGPYTTPGMSMMGFYPAALRVDA